VKQRLLVLIYRDYGALKRFSHDHGLGYPLNVRADSLQIDMAGLKDFDYMLVDSELTPEWEKELERRQCTHVVPVTRWRYRIGDVIAKLVDAVLGRVIAFVEAPRVKRVRVLK
jgi:hypothetical protein